ncbi:MAG: dihydrodipicolinate synthase family protein [Pseudomonadota bacterium]
MPPQDADPCPIGMRGIVPSLNTPFDAQGNVDEAALRRLVDETIAAGCQGILAIAVAGEQSSLTLSEKDRMARIITETAKGRLPVVISVTSQTASESRQLAAMARSANAAGICCQAPSGLQGEDLLSFFQSVADQGPNLLMIQDLDWGGGGLPLGQIERLFTAIPAFQCLKIETVPAGPKYTAVLDATGGALHVSGGWAVGQMIDALDRGVHAFMPTTMDRLYVAIHQAHCSGNRDAARALFDRLLPVLAFSNQHIDVSIRFFKMLRQAEGVFSTDTCRPPIPPLDEFQLGEARRLIRYVKALQCDVTQSTP